MALSVFKGWRMILYWSRRTPWLMLLRGYLGLRAAFKVLGRRKVVDFRSFLCILEWTPLRAAFFASAAFLVAGPISDKKSPISISSYKNRTFTLIRQSFALMSIFPHPPNALLFLNSARKPYFFLPNPTDGDPANLWP